MMCFGEGSELPREALLVVMRKSKQSLANLPKIVHAFDSICLGFCAGEHGQKHSGKYSNDRDDDK